MKRFALTLGLLLLPVMPAGLLTHLPGQRLPSKFVLNGETVSMAEWMAATTQVASTALATPIKLHGHPQLAFYTDTSQFACSDSQVHWNDLLVDPLAHTHTRFCGPKWGETTGPQVFTFTITSFEAPTFPMSVDGSTFSDLGKDIPAHDWFWDETGSGVAPLLVGDPTPGTVLAWTGHVTFDPPTVASGGPLHGWFGISMTAETRFTDQSRTIVRSWSSMYSMVDPTAPENQIACCVTSPTSQAEGFVFGSPTGSNKEYGDGTIKVLDFLPLPTVPLAGPLTVPVSFIGYGTVDLPPALLQMRHDFDFHHGKQGIVDWQKFDANNGGSGPETLTIDPAVLGPGSHKVGFFRTQANADGTEQTSTLMVFDVLVAAGVPPPLICTDPTATNFNGPLPCVYPPPPPAPITVSCTGVGSGFLQIKADGTFSLSNGSGATTCTKQ